jgi:hypothetical protein
LRFLVFLKSRLVSLAERVALAGGTLAHGPDGGGDFALTAAFPWQG